MSKKDKSDIIDRNSVEKATEILQKYKRGKANLENRVIENEQWWKLRHWDYIRSKDSDEKPTSAWLFNSIANKHADAMDNYPEPNVLARTLDDEKTANDLSTILPVVLEQNNYDDVYSDTWWYKLKQGTGIKGVFWNASKNNGLGDIDIKQCDILNLFWEPGIKDIQKSRNLFHVTLIDNDILNEQYPELKLSGNSSMDVATYIYDDDVDTTNKSVLVDWYYKKNNGHKEVLHYVKYVNDTVLYASENTEEYRERGFYDHGLYPFVFDTLFVEEGTPCGFGYIDIMRDPQKYIDELNQIVLLNAKENGRTRWLINDSAGINEDDFKDPTKVLLHVPNLREDTIREVKAQPMDPSIQNIISNKIEELKETSGNRDFSQGSTSNGVTAASAISALMEAGSKLSRDMISSSYRSFVKECYICIELIRQFYTLPRQFRITGKESDYDYVTFDNAGMQTVSQGMAFDTELGERIPIFDIKVSASKKATYSRMAQNELALQLFGLGIFNPQNADQALMLLEIMDFDGKEKIIQKVKDNGTMYEQMMHMQQQIAQMASVIEQTGIAPGIQNQAMMQGQSLNIPNPQTSAPQTSSMTPQEKGIQSAQSATEVG